jgi:uncharacterized protein with NRDE domain
MCVVALAFHTHAEWQLVLAGNRDEFHARPSAPLARWHGEDSHIIGGRDLQSGGTWLGVSEHGRLAVVTNIRTGQLPDPAKLSRGKLIAGFLRGQLALDDDLARYNPFSLFAINASGARFAANRPTPAVTSLNKGIHSLSNGLPTDPWPRREYLHNALTDWLAIKQANPEALFTILADETPLSPDDGQAPIFIRDEHYGTRCSTVAVIDYEGRGQIIERRFGPDGICQGTTELAFAAAILTQPSPTARR